MYFVDRNQIEKALVHIEELLALYKKEEDWNVDLIHTLALTRLSHDIIEAIIDVGNTMIDGFIMRDPGSYEDIIDILIDEKVLQEKEENTYKDIIQLRESIVRDYLSIDHEDILQTLTTNQQVLERFSTRIRRYLENELGVAHAFSNEDN